MSLPKMFRGADESAQPVLYESQLLPPRAMRFCGLEFKDDAYYLKSARLEVQRLVTHCGLGKSSRLLDVGCGAGRLAVGVIAELGAIESYLGLDVHLPAIAWCTEHLSARHPALRFVHVNVQNERYNPEGVDAQRGLSLPVEDASVDVINLYSVFSHMTYGDIMRYLKELRRVIRPAGRMFLTAFIEDNVPNYALNPRGYREEWEGALHCVRFERSFFEGMLKETGFRIAELVHARETNGQSALYIAPDA